MSEAVDENRKIIEQSIEFLVPGMELARDIYSSDGKILFNQNNILSQHNIQKLGNWKIPKVFVYSEVATANPITDPKLQKFINTYNQSVPVVQKAFEDIRSSQEIPLDALTAAATDIASDIAGAGNVIDRLYNLPPCDDYTMYHSVNVSAISALIAIWLKYPPESVNAISLAGLLHDVGKSLLPPELLHMPGKLSPDDYEHYRQHVAYGYDLVSKIPNISQSITAAVFQHHERRDGSGYPGGITDYYIHPYAKIVAVADLYDEGMTINRENPQAELSPYVSLQTLRNELHRLDPKICITFLDNMTNFLSGNRVSLTDNRQGRVVFINKEQPARSMVRLDDGTVLDLREEENISIHYIIR
ncbi:MULTISPECIES: HD-GYP domain-containing protein [Sporomusa]|uniref:Cyclic di-GMP phosphodiesterase response regulator RpfG n=2 Tax=Sporomusa TaxID=2375 RepID=A0ABM9W1R0_9FIRM|nr:MULTISPECIES: HD domain-containing phosphohydrolase [Sporomusa]OLS55955.1 cyclic di-GMP phosphodiesterase response regulator RpfG [Sporomusa sphaeroides DSM 2875]CVK18955.1 Cyclic di-GMP phosphodiesterase response regulator RpfG [Sporomusa sphaeroides DSM 2875]SCM79448.1 Metal dependent phosphohydrolase [uncultured Sporomusa sp.]HML34656.1 HD domain-containing phosphohydrolase [Sporomusa sphaeroides]